MLDAFSQKIFESLKWLFRWLFDLEIKGEEWQCRVTIHDYKCAKLQLKLDFESTDGIVFRDIESFFRYALQTKILQPDPCIDLKQTNNCIMEREIDFGAPALTKNMASIVDTLKRCRKKLVQDILLQLFKNARSTREHDQGLATEPSYFSGYNMGVPRSHQDSDRDDSGMFLPFIEKNDLLVVREVGFSQAAKICGFEINGGHSDCPRISRLEMIFLHAQMNGKTHDQKKNGLTASKNKNQDSSPGGMKQTRKLTKQNDMQGKSSSNSNSRQATNSKELRSENSSRGLKYDDSGNNVLCSFTTTR